MTAAADEGLQARAHLQCAHPVAHLERYALRVGFESERYASYAQDLMDEVDSRTLAPMLEAINKSAADLVAYCLVPLLLQRS